MKLKNLVVGVAVSVALVGAAVAQPQRMGPGMMGGGYGMGNGTMFGYTSDAYAGLDLTPEQQKTMAETQKAMFELQLDGRKKIDAVLTKEQREKLSRYWSSH